ncbi:MAG: hypothetical protein K8T25_17520 [Planctomycetia bacterium]|nr:hypothetical protein [Planctomycetia bacterium]
MLASHTPRERPNPNLIYRERENGQSAASSQVAGNKLRPESAEPPMVPIARPVDPADYQLAANQTPARPAPARFAPTRGTWHAPTGIIRNDDEGDVAQSNVPPPPVAQPYQAVRQQPPQQTETTVIEQ